MTVRWIGSCIAQGIISHWGKNVQEASKSTLRTRASFQQWVAADSPEKDPAEAANFPRAILSVCKQGCASLELCKHLITDHLHTQITSLSLFGLLRSRGTSSNLYSQFHLAFLVEVVQDRKRKVGVPAFSMLLWRVGIQLLLDRRVTEVTPEILGWISTSTMIFHALFLLLNDG